MDHNNQFIWNSTNASSSQPGFGSSSTSAQPSSSNVVPNQSSFFPPGFSGHDGIGSSSSSYILNDSHISSPDLSHERVLVGFLVTSMVRIGYRNEGKQIMIRLVPSTTSGHERQNFIKVVTIDDSLVGYINGFIADLLAELIDSGLISIQGITMPLSGRCIPCEVHVFAKMEMRDEVIYNICHSGVNFVLSNSEHFQSSIAAGILCSKSLKSVDEIFSLMEKELSNESVLEPMEAPTDVISTELLPHQKEGLRWLFMRENTTDLPPFFEQKGGMFVNMLTLKQTHSRPEPFRGGIYADDMGMGKTLTLLALIATDKWGSPNYLSTDSPMDNEPVIWTGHKFQKQQAKRLKALGKLKVEESSSSHSNLSSRTTLVVCPASVLAAWIEQIEVHVRRGSLRTYLYHGKIRTRNANEFKNYDIVLTTYSIVSNEIDLEESPLRVVDWWRIILDDAHDVKDWTSFKSYAIQQLNSPRRWVVTGTPIQNDILDVFPLIAFLRLEPLDVGQWWNECIRVSISSGDTNEIYRLQVLMATISLRRTKDKCLTGLPRKTIETIFVDLTEKQREVYTRMEADAKNYVKLVSIVGEYQGTNLLSLLLNLRLSCLDISLCSSESHQDLPSLQDVSAKPALVSRVRQMLAENEDGEFDCPICLASQPKVSITACGHMFCHACIVKALRSNNRSCPLCRQRLLESDLFSVESEVPFSSGSFSSSISAKAVALVKLLTASKDEDPTIKSVVFSQFKKFLIILEGTLKAAGFNVVRIDGSLQIKKRGQIVEDFGKPDGPTILLASMNVACKGINLNAASRVYLMEPGWNPTVEEQAMDRVHRIGQTREVKVTRIIAVDTIEQRILRLQEKKKLLAQTAFERRGTEVQREITASDVTVLMDI